MQYDAVKGCPVVALNVAIEAVFQQVYSNSVILLGLEHALQQMYPIRHVPTGYADMNQIGN